MEKTMIKFYVKSFTVTPNRLANYLQEKYLVDAVVTSNKNDLSIDDNIVCWGTNLHPVFKHAINNTPSLSRSEFFNNLGFIGLPVPKWNKNPFWAVDENPSIKSWLSRSEYGYGGNDLRLYYYKDIEDEKLFSDDLPESPTNTTKGRVFVEFIEKIAEFRLHFCGDNIILCRKTRNSASDSYSDTGGIAWNYSHGYNQITIKNKFLEELLGNMAIRAKEKLNLDFGAFDIIVDKNGKFAFLEVNKCPALEAGNRLDFYAEYFIKYFSLKD